MAGDGKNRWIVLLNKSPRGPLSEEDIKELLRTNVLRRNDIAYLVSEKSDSKAPTEWKLLWQFPEFDRRREPQIDTPEKTVDYSNRRKHEAVVEIQEKTLAQVPEELLRIAPEDLLPRPSSSLSLNLEREIDSDDDGPTVIMERRQLEDSGWMSPKMIFGGFAAVLVLVAGWMLYSTGHVQSTVTTEAPRPLRQSSGGGQPSARTPAANAVRRAPPPPPSVQPERRAMEMRYPEPDLDPDPELERGEIPEEEMAEENPDDAPPSRTARGRRPGGPGDPRDPRLADPRLAPRRPARGGADADEAAAGDEGAEEAPLGEPGESDPTYEE